MSHPARPSARWRNDQCDSLLELLGTDTPCVNFSYNAAGVDEHRSRLPFDFILAPHEASFVQRDGKRHRKELDEPLDVPGASLLVAAVHSDDVQPRRRVLRLHPDELGKLITARRTPCAPEGNNDGMTAHLRQLDATAGQRGKIYLGCTLADLFGLGVERACSCR